MEWKDILSWIVPLGLMVIMMRFGGCCGGHRHGGSQHGDHSAGGCCGGASKNAGPEKEPEKKACH